MTPLTEAHYWAGRRCHKALGLLKGASLETWFIPEDAEEHARLLRLAAHVLPGPAVKVEGAMDERLRLTQQILRQGRPMWGATASHEGWVAVADYLGPLPEGGWRLVAVSAAPEVTSKTLQRLAFQAGLATRAGVEVRAVVVLHLNPNYRRGHRLEPSRLFEPQDVTVAAACRSRGLENELSILAAMFRLEEPPAIALGPHCEEGGDCPFKACCWAALPEHNIFHLYQLNRSKAFKLYHAGHVRLELLPRHLRTPHRLAQQYAVASQRPYVDRQALRNFLSRLEYPLHCLDFETVNASIPWLPGIRPLETIPVQFSITHVKTRGGPLQHETFVCTGSSDPRPPMLTRLQSSLGRRGSILAYNAPFEQGVMEALAGGNRADEAWCESLKNRWVDMLEPFKKFFYYHPQQKGSCTLKAVLPALTGRGYEDLNIRDGHQATRAWQRLIFDGLPAEEAARLRQDLVAYCRRDTDGLAWMVQALEGWG